MQVQQIHIVPTADGWENRLEGSSEPLSRHASKMDAVHAGRSLAREADGTLVIHRRDGAPPVSIDCRRRRSGTLRI